MIAIHHRKDSFSERWIEYCEINNYRYKIVDCYSSDIIQQLTDCVALMWHWHHNDHKAVLFAHQLIAAVEAMGKKVFPNSNTSWHFDDKLGQKYLLEATGIPMVASYVFYSEEKALHWAMNISYPIVFKLRSGAGAENVQKIDSFKSFKCFAKRAFGKGFKLKRRINFLQERIWHFRRDRTIKEFFNISKGVLRLFLATDTENNFPPHRHYLYCQEFIPNNSFDIRVVVIGNKAFAIKRIVRSGDFRASGSGNIVYEKESIPENCIRIAFNASKKLKTQCFACDFVFRDGSPLIVEIGYAFTSRGYRKCPGYWTENLDWVDGAFIPEYFMIEDFYRSIVSE